MKYIIGFIIGAVLAMGGPALASNPENPPRWMSTPCKYEDSSNCFWDAQVAGNGKGHSFYSIRIRGKDCIVYWQNRYARKHNRCYSN